MPALSADPAKKVILLIDDDHGFLKDYKRGLLWFCRNLAHYEVETKADPMAALAYVRTAVDRIALYVIDSMMAHDGEFDADETKSGLWTGVILLREIARLQRPNHTARVIFLTNANPEELTYVAKDLTRDAILSKTKYHPKKLAEYVDNLLSA